MDRIIRIGMDTSKQVFQLHGVNAAETPCLQRKLRRSQMIEFFTGIEPTVIGIEASGAAHHWARLLGTMGHEVKIIAPQFVKPYVKRGKNDAADAEALCEAMSRPTMRFIPIKSVEQQAALMLVSLRSRLVRSRTQLTNTIRGHAAEFGLIAGRGIDKIWQLLQQIREDKSLPMLARSLFGELESEFLELDTRLKRVDAQLTKYHRTSSLCQRLSQIPGVGPVGATGQPPVGGPIGMLVYRFHFDHLVLARRRSPVPAVDIRAMSADAPCCSGVASSRSRSGPPSACKRSPR
jgi:transposase